MIVNNDSLVMVGIAVVKMIRGIVERVFIVCWQDGAKV
jgi:hypothetical protein